MARSTRHVAGSAGADGSDPGRSVAEPTPAGEEQNPARDLNFRQAQAALDLALAQLQASDLDVEAMADLYRRARSFADRCEEILIQVEQEVQRWDPEQPEAPPHPYRP